MSDNVGSGIDRSGVVENKEVVVRDRLIGHFFGSIARRKRRRAKIMAPYYRQLFTANPMVLTPFSAGDLEGVISRSRK